MVTGCGTIPAPKSSRSTLSIHHRLRGLCQLWQVCCRIDGRHCGSVFYTWTEWSLYLRPELQAASPVLMWWAKRTQLAFLEGVRRSIWSRIWWSTTLATRNMLSCYILCHIDTHYYVLLLVMTHYVRDVYVITSLLHSITVVIFACYCMLIQNLLLHCYYILLHC